LLPAKNVFPTLLCVKGRRKFHSEKTEKTNLVIPSSVKKQALERAKLARLSLSQWVVQAMCKSIEQAQKYVIAGALSQAIEAYEIFSDFATILLAG